MRFVVLANLNDLVVNLRRRGTFRKHVFTTDPLNGLRHYSGCTHIHQQVAEFAGGRVARNAGRSITAAALNPKVKLGNIKQLPLLQTCLCRHFPCGTHTFFNRFQRTALVLDTEGNHRLGCHSLNFFPQLVVRDGFTSKTDDHDTVDIRIACKSGQNLLAHIGICLNIRAAGIENDIHSASDLTGNNSRCFTAAGTGRQDQNMVANAGTALASAITPKLHFPSSLHHFRIIISGNTEQVVVCDPVSFSNEGIGFPQRFIIFDDFPAFRNIR